MAQGEGVFVDGSGSQLSTGSRWGDYTSMNVDPVDDCTFWYINEYYPVTHNTEWYLRIGAFKFPSCGASGADLSLVKADTPDPVVPGGTVTYTLDIANAGPLPVTSTVTVVDDLPAGVTIGSYSAPGWTCNQVGQQFTCITPTLPVGTAQIEIVATAPATTGYVTNTAEITSTVSDPNPTNNSSQAVTLVDTAPVARDDSYTTTEDIDLVIPAPGVLGNDNDPDSDPLAAALAVSPTHGTVVLNADGSFTYSPDPDYYGADAFTYTASDGYLADTAVVTIDVSPVNDAPVAADDAYAAPEDTPLAVPAPGVLGNDSDPDDDPLSAVLEAGPAYGDLALNADGSFIYTPTLNWNGTDVFTYTASDGALTDTAVVTIDVSSVNDGPVAADDAYTTTEDVSLVVAAPGVLANDIDPDADPLTAMLSVPPTHGTVTLNADGSFTYTPDLNYDGADAFTYAASDGELTDTATVSLTLSPVNDAPIVDAGDDQQGDEGAVLSFTGSFTEPEGQAVAIFWDFGDGATMTGTLTPTHAYGDEGIYTVTLIVTDTLDAAGMDTLVVTVDNVAPALAPLPDREIGPGEALTVTVSFTDPGWLDAHVVTLDWGDGVTETRELAAGVLEVSTVYTYTVSGVYTVTVSVEDEDGGLDSLAFTVTVADGLFRVYLPLASKNG